MRTTQYIPAIGTNPAHSKLGESCVALRMPWFIPTSQNDETLTKEARTP